MEPVTTLTQLYELLDSLRDTKRHLVASLLKGEQPAEEQLGRLKVGGERLSSVPKEGKKHVLYASGTKVLLTLHYTLSELEKDIIYLSQGTQGLYAHFQKFYPSFQEEVDTVVKQLKEKALHVLITDRDGTINNYSENYNLCTQSVYNACFLHQFAKKMRHTIIVTSAPLQGLREQGLLPEDDSVIYAGSKGRAYLHRGTVQRQPLGQQEQDMLSKLKERLLELLEAEHNKLFSLIGSGFQEKHGQLTIARQDINHSVSDESSRAFLETIKRAVKEVDPEEAYFSIEDTGLDIEILLKTKADKAFDKGDGIAYVSKQLHISDEHRLICGDTESDLSLITEGAEVIFVTQDERLKQRVKEQAPQAMFVSHPDTLISILERLSEELP
ncbi:hypothetical protein GF367_04145 [Candidatus Woesearchaeota archaeon]|nr:hypothetical protein [Candidatus Woesearchaeota archaeon]